MIKGQTSFIYGLFLFLAFIIFMTGLMATRYPNFLIINSVDLAIFGGGFVTTAIACASAGGIPCVASAGVFVLIGNIASSNAMISALLITPLTLTLAYVCARLARGH